MPKKLTTGQVTVLTHFAGQTAATWSAIHAMKSLAYTVSKRALLRNGYLVSTGAFPYYEATESGRAALAAHKAA